MQMLFWGGFFVLSGYFCNYKSRAMYWKSKFRNVLIPLCISVIVIFVISVFVYGESYNVGPLDFIMNLLCIPMITTFFAYVDGAHWYVVYLFYFYIIYWLMNLIQKRSKERIQVELFMAIFGCLAVASMFIPEGGNFAFKAFKILFNSRLVFLVFGYFIKFSDKYHLFFSICCRVYAM